MHSLHYLLPLLRRGVNARDKAMIDRFYFLVHDWFNDNKPGGPTSRYAWGPPIYEGFRSLVLVCAAAGPRGNAPWLLKALKQNGEMAASPAATRASTTRRCTSRWGSTRSASRIGRPAWRRLAVARDQRARRRLIHTDGSDEEGALTYAVNDYRWFGQAAERMRRAGDPVPAGALPDRTRCPASSRTATRPDGRIEALGDGSPSLLGPKPWVGTAAEWSVDRRRRRLRAERHVRRAYAGGYVFGRSGWGSGDPAAGRRDLLQRPRRPGQRHPARARRRGLADALLARLQLLFDTGQWEYLYGTTRSFIVSRAAHNAVARRRGHRSRPRPELRTAQATGLDITTVVDRGYQRRHPHAHHRVRPGRRRRARVGPAAARPRRCAPASSGASAATAGHPRRRTPRTPPAPAPTSRCSSPPAAPRWTSRRRQEVADARLEQRGVRRAVAGAVAAGHPAGHLAVLADRASRRGPTASPARRSRRRHRSRHRRLGRCSRRRRGSATVNLDGRRRLAHRCHRRDADRVAAAPIVLAGTDYQVRGTGLTPSAPVTLESLADRRDRPGPRSRTGKAPAGRHRVARRRPCRRPPTTGWSPGSQRRRRCG